jgi:hypothetical protein
MYILTTFQEASIDILANSYHRQGLQGSYNVHNQQNFQYQFIFSVEHMKVNVTAYNSSKELNTKMPYYTTIIMLQTGRSWIHYFFLIYLILPAPI